MSEPFYITTAISYPNGPPHIGHAYEAIAADVIARFQRSQGRDVRFQTGTDEHGLKMAQTARAEGIEPRALADRMSRLFQEMCDTLNVSYDRFIRTSQPDHYRASQAIWKAMAERGDLYLDRYEGWYSVRDEAYYEEDELVRRRGRRKAVSAGNARSNGPSRRAGSSGCRNISSRCSTSTLQSRSSFSPIAAATRSSASSRAVSRISVSRAPASTGACRCLGATIM